MCTFNYVRVFVASAEEVESSVGSCQSSCDKWGLLRHAMSNELKTTGAVKGHTVFRFMVGVDGSGRGIK